MVDPSLLSSELDFESDYLNLQSQSQTMIVYRVSWYRVSWHTDNVAALRREYLPQWCFIVSVEVEEKEDEVVELEQVD